MNKTHHRYSKYISIPVILIICVLSLSMLGSCSRQGSGESGVISVEDEGEHLLIHAPTGSERIPYNSIYEIEYLRVLDDGELKDGIDDRDIMSGTYNTGEDEYHVYIYKNAERYLLISYYGGTPVIFNVESEDEFFKLKDDITDKAFSTDSGNAEETEGIEKAENTEETKDTEETEDIKETEETAKY